MSVVFKSQIFDVAPYVPGKPIEEVKRELGLNDVVKLASNESPFVPSPRVLRAIAKAALTLNRYPEGGCFYLRETLAKKLRIKPDQLIFGNGSDEIIVMAIRAIVGPQDEVIIAQPSFLIYDIAARLEGARVRAVPLKGFYYDLPAMQSAINENTKVIFIGNPDNPCGTYIPKTALLKFLNSVPSHILVFLDEAYYEFVDEKDYPDSLSLIKKFSNVLVTRTFSKMYGLAGLRVGYGIARPEIIAALNRLREPFNVNSLAQAAAVACLNDTMYYGRVAKVIKAEKAFLYTQLTKRGWTFEKSYTNFILVKVNGDATAVTRDLMKKGVIVRDMSHWGLKNYIRVTIGSRKENNKFINVLEDVL